MKYRIDHKLLKKSRRKQEKFPYCRHSVRQAISYNRQGYTWGSMAKAMGLSPDKLKEMRKRYEKDEAEKKADTEAE